MNALRQLKIGARLGLAFAAVLLLLTLLGAFGVYQMNRANFYANDLGTNWLPSVRVLGEVRSSLDAVRRVALRHVIAEAADEKKALRKRHQETINVTLPKLFTQYEALIASPEEKSLYEDMRAKWARYRSAEDNMLESSDGGEATLAATRVLAGGLVSTTFNDAQAAMERLLELNVAGGRDANAAAAASYAQSLYLSATVIVGALVLGVVLALLVTRSITVPLSAGVAVAEAVADGDLTSNFEIQGRDEAADLLRALQHMNERLADIVGQVRLSSDSIATGSAEIATGNADLSQRTEQQASNLEETAASMEELNSTVKTNADTAQQANRLASEATQAAEQGGAVVGRVVATMQDISASSKKISDIIGVIDGISFQTNILALNAAVEAARAGEQGRGFAVVASEVRSLAGRSAEAAKEIKTLIGASVEKVEAGTTLVDEAGQSMEGIVTQVKRVSALISEISSASMEQSSGISQIGDAVNQLDQVTQQNAALVEESAAAADSLKNQSQRLAELVSVFKITGQPARLGQANPAPLPSRQFGKAPAMAPLTKAAAPSRPTLGKSASPALTSSAKSAAGGNEDWESF